MSRLTDMHWEKIREHFPKRARSPMAVQDAGWCWRATVLDAVLWILNTGAQWHMLPQSYPNYKTVHRRFQWGVPAAECCAIF